MFRTLSLLVIALIAALTGGCAVSHYEGPNGSGTAIQWLPSPVVVGSPYDPYGVYTPRRIYDPTTRTLEIREHRGNEPTNVRVYDARGNVIQAYPTCGGGRDPIGGKC